MAYRGKLEYEVQDTSGNAKASISVDVRKRGATVNGFQSSVTTITVFNPGAVVAGDVVKVNGAGTAFTVNSVTATTVVVGAAATVSSLDRLVTNAGPSVYVDSSGTTSKTNPLTTDANGYAFCYTDAGYYDAVISGTGITTYVDVDRAVYAERMISPMLDTSNVAYVMDTTRALATTDKILSVRSNGTEKFYVRGDGSLSGATFNGAVAVASGGLTVTSGGATIASGGLTVSASGADITGNTTIHDILLMGPAGLVDCNLYRDSANVLKTDDSLTIAGTLSAAGYLKFASYADITVASSTLTIPATGNVFYITASSPQTVTTISGGPGNGFPVFLYAKPGTSAITFNQTGNIATPRNANLSMANTNSSNIRGAIFAYDGTTWNCISDTSAI